MNVYETVSDAINGLKKRGFTIDFNMEHDRIVCEDAAVSLAPDEFEIVEVYRFEGETNPSDEAVVYAIQSKHGHNGVLVNGYGIYADPVSEEMIEKLKVVHH